MENFFIIDTFLLLLRDCLIFLIIDWLGFSIVYARMYYYYFIELKRPWFILNNIVSTELINATRKLFIDSYNSYDWLQDVCRWLDLFQQDRNKNRIATKNVFSCRNPLLVLLLLSLFVFFSWDIMSIFSTQFSLSLKEKIESFLKISSKTFMTLIIPYNSC